MSEENILLTPEEVENRRKQRRTKVEEQKQEIPEKFYNRGGTVAINYETMGRFDIPATLYFKDFTIKDENDISLTRKEDLLETTIAILNTLKNEDANCKIEDMLIEEFFETLIGIKKQFDTHNHVHLWICNCQSNEDNPHVNESVIDLNAIKYQNIIEGDNVLKDYYRRKLERLSDDDFKEYLYTKYKDNPSIELENRTKEEEVENIKIKEPFLIKADRRYLFRLPRIGDLVKAQKIASKKFNEQVKEIENRKNPNTTLPILQSQKKEEIEKIREEELKFVSLVTRALSLMFMDEKELGDEEKIKIYSALPRSIKKRITAYFEQFDFGIHDEYTFVCPLCKGEDRRLLQRELDVFELLPSYPVTYKDDQQDTGPDIFVGA